MQATQNPMKSPAPVYSSGLSRLPQPLLIEPLEVDAALARLLGANPTHAPARPNAKVSAVGARQAAKTRTEVEWDGDWTHNDMSGVEVTEHLLPEGLDFAAFHALLKLAH
jgi:hypothetical protein